MTSSEQFKRWLGRLEDVNLEFKSAENSFPERKLSDYCAAIANEGGGELILGIDSHRRVVGTKVFSGTYNKLSNKLFDSIRIRIDVEELKYSNKRVLIFHIPSHTIGQVIKSNGKYLMRLGESLCEMDSEQMKKILNEAEPDFSASVVEGFSIKDMDDAALENFKKRWAQKAKRKEYLTFTNEKILRAINLLSDKGLNYASLILFGKKEKIDHLLAGAEIIFEWRGNSKKISHDFRVNWRESFFKIYDKIWETINVRNLRIPFQEGLFQREIFAFSEKPIREALLNAVAHRDYMIGGCSIFIKVSPEEFVIESPGGFPGDVTVDNILEKTCWRNRSIAETFEKAGLVERSGQGMDDIYGDTIKEGKGVPDLSKSDASSVTLKIPAKVKDKDFILFLEKIAKDKDIILSFEEIYVLEKIREHQVVIDAGYKDKFLKLGLIERVGRTKGARYILSHNYYRAIDKTGLHTRLAGLMREAKKELILGHLKKYKRGYFRDFSDAFPDLKRGDISNLLAELKRVGNVRHAGTKKNGYWELARLKI